MRYSVSDPKIPRSGHPDDPNDPFWVIVDSRPTSGLRLGNVVATFSVHIPIARTEAIALCAKLNQLDSEMPSD